MPDAFMPDVEVHIAFGSGYTTPAASRTWTDVSAYVELADRIAIAFGRQDERSTAGANTLTLTLDNSDGRFTAGRAASPYFPNVKIGRPIRVRVTPPGGSAVTRFVGFVDEWPVEWEGTDRYATARIRASSRQSRLGLSAKMRSMVEESILANSPTAYYTMGDPSGATSAAESSGNNAVPLTVDLTAGNAVVFGNATGFGTDGITAAEFVGPTSQTLVANGIPTAVNNLTLRFAFLAPAAPSSGLLPLVALSSGASNFSVTMQLTTAGNLQADVSAGANVTLSVAVSFGQTHDVAVVIEQGAGDVRLYVDGILATSAGGLALSLPAATDGKLSVGSRVGGATLAHVALYGSVLLPADALAQATAGLTGFSGERTDQRAVRLLGWAGVAATEVTTETGSEAVTYQKTSGQSVVDALRDVEATEGGVLFDGRDGNVTFHNRSRRYLATPAATLNMAAQHVEADYAPKLDRSALLNDVEVSNPTTEEKARSTSTASSDEYGIATGSATSVANTYDALQQKAAWMVASYAEPRIRVPSLSVDVLAHQGLTPSAQTLLGLTVGDLLAVTNAPTQADTTNTSYFIEGYAETIGPQSYGISFNLSPTHPTLSTFVIQDATRGQLDSTYVLAL